MPYGLEDKTLAQLKQIDKMFVTKAQRIRRQIQDMPTPQTITEERGFLTAKANKIDDILLEIKSRIQNRIYRL